MKIKLEPPVVNTLHQIQQRMELADKVEVIRRALAVYDCITNLLVEGGEILWHDHQGNFHKIAIK